MISRLEGKARPKYVSSVRRHCDDINELQLSGWNRKKDSHIQSHCWGFVLQIPGSLHTEEDCEHRGGLLTMAHTERTIDREV